MTILREEQIGGAFVKRLFHQAGEPVKAGTKLTRADVLAFPQANRQALVDGGYIDVYPPAPSNQERFIASAGFGNWHVYEGRRLTTGKGLTKEEAEALAAEGAEPDDDGDDDGDADEKNDD